MIQMLTLFGEDLRNLKYNDLKRELRAQKFILLAIKNLRSIELSSRRKRKNVTQLSLDKEALSDTYIQHLEAFISEIEYVMAHRSEPISNFHSHRSQKQIRQENAKKRKAVIAENTKLNTLKKHMGQEIRFISWDRDKFMHISEDRGYQTEDAIIQDVGKELNLDLGRAKMLVDKGRFTWGQVLCIGAMLSMTPKEFCDTFLAGYFTDQFGEYRASYDNLHKPELLKYVIRPTESPQPVMREVEIDVDDEMIDQEAWLD